MQRILLLLLSVSGKSAGENLVLLSLFNCNSDERLALMFKLMLEDYASAQDRWSVCDYHGAG